MKKNKVVKKLVAVVLIVACILGITVVHINKSKADDINDNSIVNDDVNNLDDIEMTETLREYFQDMSNMTEEEFYEVFSNEMYNNEFEELYKDNVTRSDIGDCSDVNSQNVEDEFSEEDINSITQQMENKIPSAIREKFDMNYDKLKVVVKKSLLFIAKKAVVYGIVYAVCSIFPKWSKEIVKIIVELAVVLAKNLIREREVAYHSNIQLSAEWLA